MSRPTWDEYFMSLANLASSRSICVSRHVGAVLVQGKQVISTGYNGPPRGSNLCHDGICIWPRSKRANPSDLSGCPAAHAEANCINQAARSGVNTEGAVLYCNCGIPCKSCLVTLINAGVVEIVCLPTTEGVGKYYDALSKQLVDEGLIRIRVLNR